MKRHFGYQPEAGASAGTGAENSGTLDKNAERRRRLLAMKSGRRAGRPADWSPRITQAEARGKKAAELKAEHLKDHPDDLEGAELVAGMLEFLDNQRRLSRKEVRGKKERLAVFQDLTEFNFLWTHYLQSINDDPQAVRDHWDRLRNIADSQGPEAKGNYFISRSGILSQVAVMEVFERLGLHPNLAKPSEDAFKETDLWLEKAPVQVKTNVEDDEVRIVKAEANAGAPLHAAVEHGSGQAQFAAAELDETASFRLKLDKYSQELDQLRMTGFFVTIPKNQIDRTTGKPTEKLISDVRAALEELGYLQGETESLAA